MAQDNKLMLLKFYIMCVENDSLKELAKDLGISVSTLSRRLEGESKWKHDEVVKIKERYNFTDVQMDHYF